MDPTFKLYWDRYIHARYKAYRSLLKIIYYQAGAVLNPAEVANSPEEFAELWGQTYDETEQTATLKRDAVPWLINLNDGTSIEIRFITRDVSESKIPKAVVAGCLLTFMKEATGIQDVEEMFSKAIELVKGKRLILVSMAPLEGSARNEIVEFNSLLEFPIRHFTVSELQYDPTKHATQPSRLELATPAEIRELINNQIGLAYGTTRLAPDYEETLASFDNDADKIDYQNKIDELILSKIPTRNTEDPLIKWRGFRAGDILKCYRRVGLSKFSWIRVVYLDPVAIKPPKSKAVMTNK